MTDAELLSYKRVGPEVAAKYLQGGYCAQELRLHAQMGTCPFMRAFKGEGRYYYRVNVGKLMRFKHGELDYEN